MGFVVEKDSHEESKEGTTQASGKSGSGQGAQPIIPKL